MACFVFVSLFVFVSVSLFGNLDVGLLFVSGFGFSLFGDFRVGV